MRTSQHTDLLILLPRSAASLAAVLLTAGCWLSDPCNADQQSPRGRGARGGSADEPCGSAFEPSEWRVRPVPTADIGRAHHEDSTEESLSLCGFSDSKPEAHAGLARSYTNENEISLSVQPSAPWPWDGAQALWTAFGIFNSSCRLSSIRVSQAQKIMIVNPFLKPEVNCSSRSTKFERTETKLSARVLHSVGIVRVDMFGHQRPWGGERRPNSE
ncbi:hypothetical protein GB937_001505 [Aspergillus fischeri]|nr:hypothetical protein GB937_001505 [Aspergillus fischeri]